MANSKTIAGLIGPSLIALAAALLINLGSMSALVEAVSHDPALVLVSGVLSFVAGLAVVRVHNHWAADWAVLVTIFGWLLLIGGLVRMLFPIWLAGMAATFSPSTGLIVGEAVVFLVIGAFLSYKAYISSLRSSVASGGEADMRHCHGRIAAFLAIVASARQVLGPALGGITTEGDLR